jgi:beta-xylosidase
MMRSIQQLGGLLTAALLALTGCAGAPETPAPASPSPAGFTNPVYPNNFPDPMIVADPDGGFWAVATNDNGSNVQTLHSTDLTRWEQGPDALPKLPDWTGPGKVWAPEVEEAAGGRYLLYYTSIGPNASVQCVGVAAGSQPEGPYFDPSHRPLVCQEDQGGTIDAHPFTTAAGKRYLYFKNDGNAVGLDTYISVAQLDATGRKLVGRPKRLFKEDLPWEGDLVEAPFVWEERGRFHLFYSANSYASEAYAVGHAVADNPMGPFTKSTDPVLTSNDVAVGPGHCALFARNGRVWMAYHAWAPGEVGSDVPGREMWLSEVTFADDGTVSVVPPTVNYPIRP